MDQFLDLEIRLLLLRYGRRRVIESLASGADESVEALERQISELESKKKTPPRSKKPTPPELVAAACEDRPGVEGQVRNLIASYENRTFLPRLREVERFLDHTGVRHSKLKSRVAALPKVIQALAGMSESQLKELLEVAAHDKGSDFALLANEIMRRDRPGGRVTERGS